MARSTDLLAVSATEQDIANADKHTEHLRMVEKVLGEAQTRPRMAESALRVVLLYALRYETNRKNQVSTLELTTTTTVGMPWHCVTSYVCIFACVACRYRSFAAR